METQRTKRVAVVVLQLLKMAPVSLEGPVRRLKRSAMPPKRLQYSPETAHVKKPKQKRRRTTTTHQTSQNDRQDVGDSVEEVSPEGSGGFSSYELERLENIRQNQVFLSSINLLEATEELKQLTRPKQRVLKRSKAAVKEALPARKSLRFQNIKGKILTPADSRRMLIMQESCKIPPGPLVMDPVNVEEGSKLPSQLLELCSEGTTEERKMELHLNEYRSALRNMRVTEGRVAKVVKSYICSAAFHPCTSSLLMAAGDRLGNVGLWKLGGDWGDDGVLLFKPHTRPVSCMAFSRAHPSQLLSLSHDGSLRCMDLEKAVFNDVYDIENGLNTFDFMSHDCLTLVVGNWFGRVAIVDRRTPGNTHESIHSLDPKCLRCVSVHPLQKQYFAVAENRVVNIYDSRYLKKTKSQPVSGLHGHSLSISNAYFSPRTGNRVLTTSTDQRMRIYDTSAMTTESPLLKSIRHIMHTSLRWTRLSAMWDPKQENCFVVGSMSHTRMVQVFHERGRLQHSFTDSENLLTKLQVTAFHPTRNALLGGNASGYLHVISD
ncbi:WD repeat-containing protein 76 isoform X2 [Cebidichthys violaceus]|uniref:WD repeat-containing protein 76 isoform X2 n=1 Tax=Cebidichthys violaceus TaxID=271503 RepID=UPI0035CA8799